MDFVFIWLGLVRSGTSNEESWGSVGDTVHLKGVQQD